MLNQFFIFLRKKLINFKTLNQTNIKSKTFFKKELKIWLDNNFIEFKNGYILFKNNCCPSCGCILSTKLSVSKKCPECKEKIIIRTNRITNQKLLLTESQVTNFDICEKERREIYFCEKQIESLSRLFPNYMKKFYEIKKNNNLTVRDITFSFENYITYSIDKKNYSLYKKYYKLPYKDRVLKCFTIINEFKKGTIAFEFMARLTEFEKKNNVLTTMLPSIARRAISIECLYNILIDEKHLNEDNLISSAYSSANLVYKFLKNNNMQINDYEEIYIKYAKPFIIDTLSAKDSWEILKVALLNQQIHNNK